MTDQLLFRNVMRIKTGRLQPFCVAVRAAVDFVEKNAPQLMVRAFIDEADDAGG